MLKTLGLLGCFVILFNVQVVNAAPTAEHIQGTAWNIYEVKDKTFYIFQDRYNTRLGFITAIQDGIYYITLTVLTKTNNPIYGVYYYTNDNVMVEFDNSPLCRERVNGCVHEGIFGMLLTTNDVTNMVDNGITMISIGIKTSNDDVILIDYNASGILDIFSVVNVVYQQK